MQPNNCISGHADLVLPLLSDSSACIFQLLLVSFLEVKLFRFIVLCIEADQQRS